MASKAIFKLNARQSRNIIITGVVLQQCQERRSPYYRITISYKRPTGFSYSLSVPFNLSKGYTV
jgi:hypothetical protein